MIQYLVILVGLVCAMMIFERVAKRYNSSYEIRSPGRVLLDTGFVYAAVLIAQRMLQTDGLDGTSNPPVFTDDPPF
jgi:hypothetical protein